MRVQKRGSDKIYKKTCSNCDSDLEYTKVDIHPWIQEEAGILWTELDGWGHRKEYQQYNLVEYDAIKCPICGKEIILMTKFPRTISTREGIVK